MNKTQRLKKIILTGCAFLMAVSMMYGSIQAEGIYKEVPGLGLSYPYTEEMEKDGFQVFVSNYNILRHLGILNARTKNADLLYVLIYPEKMYQEEAEEDHWSVRFDQKFPGTVATEETFGEYHYTTLDLTDYVKAKEANNSDLQNLQQSFDYVAYLKENLKLEELTMAAPSFHSVNLDGEQVTDEIYGEKKLTILNVWATYCNPCINEMPELAKWEKEIEADAQILYLCSDINSEDSENIPLAVKIAEKAGINRKNVIYNLPGTCTDILDMVTGVPTTFFLDENGVLLEDYVVGANVAEYKKIAEKYLNEQK